MLNWELDDGLATLALENGPLNTLDGDFLREITATIAEIDAKDVDALIVTGKGSTFSAGADLQRVLDGGREYIEASVGALSEAFGALFTFRRPMVAAINGHAIAGGCIIACAADYKVMARGSGVIGITELKVGVPFPVWAFEIMRFAAAPHRLQEITYFARNYPPEQAVEIGLVDEVVEPGELSAHAEKRARKLASIPRESFEMMKKLIRRPTVERVEAYAGEHDSQAASLWSSEEIKSSIERFMASLQA
jgi:enoyl-CoA hydratase